MQQSSKLPTETPRQIGWFKRAGYWSVQTFAWVVCKLMFGFKVTGFEQMPETGATLICANHQSNLDPILIGCISRRRMNFLAKKSLFKFPPLSWLILFLDSIPLAKEGLSAEGIKATIRCLRRQEAILMFPEGARTFDGRMTPMLPGFIAIVKRTQPIIVPVGIAGAFRAWPRTRLFPIPGPRIRLVMGRPIQAGEYAELNEEQIKSLLGSAIRDCVASAQRQLGQPVDP